MDKPKSLMSLHPISQPKMAPDSLPHDDGADADERRPAEYPDR